MKRITKMVLGAGVVLLASGGIVTKLVLDHGFSARDQPMVIEKAIARRFRLWAIPSAHARAVNPVPLTDPVLQRARAHFADHCALCHGNDGRGKTAIGQNLYPKAPDMSLQDTQGLPDGHIFYIIKNGVRLTGMPAWGQDTPEGDRETWELVHFIRHIPRISGGELAEMEGLNPRSRKEWEEEAEAERFLGGEDTPKPARGARPH